MTEQKGVYFRVTDLETPIWKDTAVRKFIQTVLQKRPLRKIRAQTPAEQILLREKNQTVRTCKYDGVGQTSLMKIGSQRTRCCS